VDVLVQTPTTDQTLTPSKHRITASAIADGAIGRVDFYVNGVFVTSDSQSPFVFDWNTSGLLGDHTVVAKAYEIVNGWEFVSEAMQFTVLSGAWNNSSNRFDIDQDGFVVPLDVLLVINSLRRSGSIALSIVRPTGSYFVDVSNDNFVSPIDVLMVINYLNRRSPASEGEFDAESEDMSTTSIGSADLFFQDLGIVSDWDGLIRGAFSRRRLR